MLSFSLFCCKTKQWDVFIWFTITLCFFALPPRCTMSVWELIQGGREVTETGHTQPDLSLRHCAAFTVRKTRLVVEQEQSARRQPCSDMAAGSPVQLTALVVSLSGNAVAVLCRTSCETASLFVGIGFHSIWNNEETDKSFVTVPDESKRNLLRKDHFFFLHGQIDSDVMWFFPFCFFAHLTSWHLPHMLNSLSSFSRFVHGG